MIIYIHGFNSSGNGSKSQKLKELFPNAAVFSPSYDSSDFNSIELMIQEIEKAVEKQDSKPLFIGCSLGGYLSQYLAKHFGTKGILLNPSYSPTKRLQRALGENTMYSTGETYIQTQENLEILKKYELSPEELKMVDISVFTNKDDDLIPYQEVVKYYSNKPVTIFEEGGHRFENLEDIHRVIITAYQNIK
ncbi:MAG: hypothetical protein GY827_07560 [Cytophagales bacterium]|nr:hypothetical protein [Cytophagales bacterium]